LIPVAQRLLSAALTVLAEEGFAALTQDRVARVARVRQSHLTYYFPKRSALLQAVAEHLATGAAAVSVGRPASLSRLRDQILGTAVDRNLARLMVSLLAAADEEPPIREWLCRRESVGREQLMAALHAAGYPVEPEAIARFEIILRGIAVSLLFMKEGDPSAALQRRAVEAWNEMIGPP